MNESEFRKQYLQEPVPLKIGDGIKLRNPRGFSIEPADTFVYKVVEFLDKGDIRIKEMFGNKEKIINQGRIGEVIKNLLEEENKHQQAYLVSQALNLILQNPNKEFCAISWLQRTLGIGYNLAADLRLELINRGILAPIDEMNRAKILVRDKDFASNCCGANNL